MQTFKTRIILFALPFLIGCSTENHRNDGAVQGEGVPAEKMLGSKFQKAYEKARTSMLREQKVNVDVLWTLNQFAGSDAELKEFIADSAKLIADSSFVPGVFPDSPCIQLSENPDRGIKKFVTYLQAAFGQPKERALSWIERFIATEEDGYVLTHQFLSLVWAEQADLPLTEDMLSRKQELWQRVYAEQYSVGGVDSIDLYFERIVILLVYGRPENVDQNIMSKWIEQVVDLQLDDGSWPLSKTRISFDGAATEVSSPRPHTTALAMMALNACRERMIH